MGVLQFKWRPEHSQLLLSEVNSYGYEILKCNFWFGGGGLWEQPGDELLTQITVWSITKGGQLAA